MKSCAFHCLLVLQPLTYIQYNIQKEKKLDFLSVLRETVQEAERSQARNMPDLPVSVVHGLGNQKNVIQISVKSMFSMKFYSKINL